MKSIITASLALTLGTALPAMAADTPQVYAYPSAQNYCLAGLQPVTIEGDISCGTPTVAVPYTTVMTHVVIRPKTHKSSYDCQIGTKGCTFD
ncbi:hypothetical protein [Pseudosulfitobacter koreensis]|uniref:Uncharacterized protein n=1 Tax=Pseudosulfitobacter koreensis TaxID=2968472 RepID=A0ABT1Z4B7_9RHOB|nr:hypothetical protein [Pseudosulfitobacter koreense]MCR8827982.1 hypothetical protein [Pseudosulfitobacter koreense]